MPKKGIEPVEESQVLRRDSKHLMTGGLPGALLMLLNLGWSYNSAWLHLLRS